MYLCYSNVKNKGAYNYNGDLKWGFSSAVKRKLKFQKSSTSLVK